MNYQRNLLGMVGASKRVALAADLRGMFTATTLPQARALATQIADRWRLMHPAMPVPSKKRAKPVLPALPFR